MSNYSIKKILLCGSQAKNLRFIKLLATVTKTPVEVSDTLPELAGVRGASYLGYSAYHNVNLAEVIYKFNDKGTIFRNESLDLKLNRLPDQKYYIMKDIAETQRRYNRLVESAISI
ncbi:hypothetical protein WICMUC_000521 [Wickerhamomyces mucosus]|uniref:Carbohydrate kinase FGGY C-terminal domain-containing protein n=1 Tax=Wickerhamomyces mucosus TaxID=1378264 RepID=A0A9P8TIQ6_9ASCO|nr:hypothetical protein WICMUC_000521 [Wickerhamomyces mucosus]